MGTCFKRRLMAEVHGINGDMARGGVTGSFIFKNLIVLK
jgi:hypothetical protein